MAARRRVILIANYRPDAQQSMLRFAGVLERELRCRDVDVHVIAPRPVFGVLRAGRSGIGKWFGYVDKLLLFPLALRTALRDARRDGADVVVHVCDHSNTVYVRYLQDVPHVVTCHDLLAIRSALGEFPEHQTRWSGRILQRMILDGLNQARALACVSRATRQDVLRLCSMPEQAVRLVYMGLNDAYAATGPERARLIDRPFILHVGGNQWYKNRLGVLRIYAAMKRLSPVRIPALVMVGERFSDPMRAFVAAHNLGADVIERNGVSNEDLETLYTQAELLFYPSLAEGFGWPIAEAMACGCRVVTSRRPPMTEVGGDAATYVDPEDDAAAARDTLAVLAETPESRRLHRDAGLHHTGHFTTEAMIETYLELYESVSLRFRQEHGAPIAAA